jgi:hypothetical protein
MSWQMLIISNEDTGLDMIHLVEERVMLSFGKDRQEREMDKTYNM